MLTTGSESLENHFDAMLILIEVGIQPQLKN